MRLTTFTYCNCLSDLVRQREMDALSNGPTPTPQFSLKIVCGKQWNFIFDTVLNMEIIDNGFSCLKGSHAISGYHIINQVVLMLLSSYVNAASWSVSSQSQTGGRTHPFPNFSQSVAHVIQAAEDHTTSKEQWVVGVAEEDRTNHGRTTSENKHASRCRHCCALRMT